ncbi:MAG TPA: hypothetical protein VGM90_16800 [Kofleriaceae bacterium]|jgi:hypothetical protein
MRAALLGAFLVVACGGSTIAPTPRPTPAPLAPLEAITSHGALVFHVRVAPLANLAYQLDCLSDTVPCSKIAFSELWHAGWTKADDDALAVWRSMRQKYGGSLSLSESSHRLSYGSRMRAASLLSASVDDYARWLDVLTRPADAAKLRTTLDHFWPRFSAWWTTRGYSIVAVQFPRFAALLGDERVAKLFELVAHFYSPDLAPSTDISFDLIARPESTEGATHAEADDTHLVLEVRHDDHAEARMTVAAHELCHFFFVSRSPTTEHALNDRFTATSDPLGRLALGLMNESLATLLGNVMVGRVLIPEETTRRIASENGLYNERSIDRTAKALVGGLEALTAGTIDDEAFFTAYLAAVHAGLGDAPPPSAYLREFLLSYSPAMRVSGERFIRESKAGSVYSSEVGSPGAVDDVTRNREFTAVAMLPPDDMKGFQAYAAALGPTVQEALAAEIKRGVPFIYAVDRPPHAKSYVLVARDNASMDALADALLARQESLQGVMR